MDVAQSDTDATFQAYLYTVGEGSKAKRIAVTLAIHYACCVKRLRSHCTLEYYCLIRIEQWRATEPMGVADGVNNGHHPQNAMFDFHPRHVLHGNNDVQCLGSQSRCPILAAKRMPVRPGMDGGARTEKAWANFVTCKRAP